MKNNIWILFKAQYRNQSSLNSFFHEKDKKKRHKTIGIFAAIAVFFLMLVIYSFLIAYGYGYLGMEQAIPGYSLAICSMITLFFTFVKTNGFLFAFKDYDIVMALPVSTKTIITAKFLYMYINNLIFSLCVMIPMCIGYAIWSRPGLLVYIIWFAVTCFTPLIPMSIAATVAAMITAIGSRFRFKVFVQVVLSLLVIVAVSSLNFIFRGAGSNEEFFRKMGNLGEMMQSSIHKIYPVSILFDHAVSKENLMYAVGFLGISLVVYIIFVILVSVKYKAINTTLMTTSSRSNYKIGKMKERSVIKALVYKEMKRFTSSVTYLMNVGIGMILAVIGSVVCLVIGVDKVLESMELGSLQQGFYYAIPFVLATPLTMTCTTCVSWSLEGKNLWILKSLPMDESTIFKGKMIFNLVLLTPASIFCNICLILALKVDGLLAILYVITSFATIAFSTTFGMLAGKKFPNFEWKNEVEVIKQGGASMLGIFVNMLLQIVLVVAGFWLSMRIDGRIILCVIAIVLFGISGILYKRVVK